MGGGRGAVLQKAIQAHVCTGTQPVRVCTAAHPHVRLRVFDGRAPRKSACAFGSALLDLIGWVAMRDEVYLQSAVCLSG